MKLIKTVDAVGQIICHDITQIIPNEFKGPRFKKGHIVTEEDIPVLLSMGKDNLFILENDDSFYHEDEAAGILADLFQGANLHQSEVKEGKIELISDTNGLLIIDKQRLNKINQLKDIMLATLPSGFEVNKGERVAGTRVIPLIIKKDRISLVKQIVDSNPLINVFAFKRKKYSVITTGNEVYYERIEDKFTPVIKNKLSHYGCEMKDHVITDDNVENIKNSIKSILSKDDVDMVICTGGMSVDPDDKTPLAIKESGVNIVSYGAPVLPGAMFLIGYLGKKVICGLPGCVMYSKRTIFDLLLPYILTDNTITSDLVYSLGNGGLCRNCNICHFPNCSFGKAGI